MQRNKILTLIGLVLLAAFVAGCKTAPVYNVTDAPIMSSKEKLADDDVKRSIIRAATALGWRVKDEGRGLLVATISRQSHTATVDIKYSTKGYSITHKNSVDLNYDGTNIHKRYNTWVNNLDRRIAGELQML